MSSFLGNTTTFMGSILISDCPSPQSLSLSPALSLNSPLLSLFFPPLLSPPSYCPNSSTNAFERMDKRDTWWLDKDMMKRAAKRWAQSLKAQTGANPIQVNRQTAAVMATSYLPYLLYFLCPFIIIT